MKRIVILTCPLSETVCTGGSCLKAFNERIRAFSRYKRENMELVAFMKCSGCGHFPGQDKGLDEKIQYVLDAKPDVVHVGICASKGKEKRKFCPEIEAITTIWEKAGIPIVRGTHSEF